MVPGDRIGSRNRQGGYDSECSRGEPSTVTSHFLGHQHWHLSLSGHTAFSLCLASHLSRPILLQYDFVLTRGCGTVSSRLVMACCHLETEVARHACAEPSQNWAYCIP